MLARFQQAADKVVKQTAALSENIAREVQQGGNKTLSSFKLENEVRPNLTISHYPLELMRTRVHECTKSARILSSFLADPSHPESALNAIPREVLSRAKGLAIFTVLKAGFVWSGKAGSGIVIARLEDGSWSAPSCIATGGVGFGLQIGADLSEVRPAQPA
jgi:hypothetical protein